MPAERVQRSEPDGGGLPMNEGRPWISVVIATYAPGSALQRVLDSLDAQTLPRDRFEVVVVDDGSPDGTWKRLQHEARARPNLRVHRIENSGWPSRPRNVGIDLARGEWVLFMDHDDSLYPHALQRAAEFAEQTGADVVSLKESKTTDVWWGMQALERGNLVDVRATGEIERIMPMVPHKLYRRAFLLERSVRFPEGRRMLWEDIHFNVAAWRHAEVVAVLADTPAYLWWSSRGNNSKSYGPQVPEFWDRLDGLFTSIDRELAGPDLARERRWVLAHQFGGRVLRRFGRMLSYASEEEIAAALTRARRIQETWLSPELEAALPKVDRARSQLLRLERLDLLRSFNETSGSVGAVTRVSSLGWLDDRLVLETETRLRRRGESEVRFPVRGGRARWEFPDDVTGALDPGVLDVTDDLPLLRFGLAMRHRTERVTWELETRSHATFAPDPEGTDAVNLVVRSAAEIRPESAAMGAPLGDGVYDVRSVLRWNGVNRSSAPLARPRARPALLAGRAADAYRNTHGRLSLDLGHHLRSVIKDGGIDLSAASASARRIHLALPAVHIVGRTVLDCRVELLPAPDQLRYLLEALPAAVRARIVARRSATMTGTLSGDEQGARVEARGDVPPGVYRVAFQVGATPPLVSAFLLRVGGDGSATLERAPVAPRRRPVRQVVDVVADRGRRVARTVYRQGRRTYERRRRRA